MEPSSTFLSVLPNLSIAAVAILGLVYVVVLYTKSSEKTAEASMKALKEIAEKHALALKEREDSIRNIEKEIRHDLLGQLGRNTQALEGFMDYIKYNSHGN